MRTVAMRRWLTMIVLSLAATALGAAADKANVSRAALDHALSSAPQAVGDWPQLGHDAQRTNDTSVQVNPPYCYTWKWHEAPIATRAQPVVANGRLFVGSPDITLTYRAVVVETGCDRSATSRTSTPDRRGASTAAEPSSPMG